MKGTILRMTAILHQDGTPGNELPLLPSDVIACAAGNASRPLQLAA